MTWFEFDERLRVFGISTDCTFSRSAFLIDTEGNIRYAWSTEEPSDQSDWFAVKNAVDQLEASP